MPLQIIKNRKGMSLVEVLVAAGLMAIVALGVTGVVTSMGKEQNNQTRIATLRELKTRFQFLISDQNSWNKTLQSNAGNALANCLIARTSCTSAGVTSFKVYDAGNNVFFDPTVAGSGFTDKGTVCNTFSATTGVDTCPISYLTVWEPICPPTGSCINPLVRVTIRALFNPSASSQVPALPLGNTNPSSPNWTDDSVAANTGKYDVVIKRSALTINKAFSVRVVVNGSGSGGGVCATSETVRTGWSEFEDPFELVDLPSPGIIRIQPGTYSCKMTGAGWAVDTFGIEFKTSGGTPVTGSKGSSNAPKATYQQSYASSSFVISPTSLTSYQFMQTCSNMANISATQYTMGMPASPYGDSVLATLSCTQTN